MKSIKVCYRGISYRSKLEAATAKFFTEHDIEFIYEPNVFEFQDGTKYLPDFYLPEQKIWVKCKGIMTDKDDHKITILANESKEGEVVVITSDGHFSIVRSEYGEYGWCEEDNTFFARCRNCGKWYFSDSNGSWECRHCGFYDGDQTYDFRCEGSEGLPDFQFDIWKDAD